MRTLAAPTKVEKLGAPVARGSRKGWLPINRGGLNGGSLSTPLYDGLGDSALEVLRSNER